MLIEHTLFGDINKEEVSIARIIEFQNRKEDKKNIVAFSGGKDSLVLKHLIERANITKEIIYSRPGVDPPELINYMREFHTDVKMQKYNLDKNGDIITMWTLIPNKLIPPSRLVRYCCDELKERTGEEGDTVYLGVRWSESNARRRLGMVGFWKGKVIVRPLIDWSDSDIWEYIRKYKLDYCKLYDIGFKRIGCIGCPLSSNQKKELEAYPKYRANYIRAFEKMIENRKNKGKGCTWNTGEDVMKWWIGKGEKNPKDENQCGIFE